MHVGVTGTHFPLESWVKPSLHSDISFDRKCDTLLTSLAASFEVGCGFVSWARVGITKERRFRLQANANFQPQQAIKEDLLSMYALDVLDETHLGG